MRKLSKKQLNKLKELKKEDVFNSISKLENDFDIYNWEEILEAVILYNEIDNTEENIKINFLREKDLKIMKSYGLDINHIDEEGNNFLMFIRKIYITMKFQPLNKEVYIEKKFLEQVEKETINKNIINKKNENLLTILVSSYNEEDFIYFKEKYNIDINIINKHGNTLLQNSMIGYSNEKKIEYLIKNGVNIENINKNNQTFLNLICIKDRNEQTINLFNQAIKEFKEETLMLKDVDGKTFYEYYISTFSLAGAYSKNYAKYVKQLIELIIEDKNVQKKIFFCNSFYEELQKNKKNLPKDILELIIPLFAQLIKNEMKVNSNNKKMKI